MTTDPLRIALISEHASPLAGVGSVDAGGQNVYVDHVARELARRGHRVDVMTRRDDPAQPPVTALAPGVRVLHLAAGPARFVPKEQLLPFMPAFVESAQRLAGRGGYDLLHANFFMSGWVGMALRERWRVPLVTTFHALGRVRQEHQREADRFPPERLDIEQALVDRSDRVLSACPQDEQDLQRLYGAHPSRLVTVPCGVDTEALTPGPRREARARLALPQDEFIVLQLGRLVPRKGIDNVVRALALLQTQAGARASRLVVVGGESDTPDEGATPEIGRLRSLACALGVGDRVQFTGRRSRSALVDWYRAADVFVTTPWYEPFGITPLEAMACAVPVIGSAVGGVQWTVVEGRTGFLVPPQDPAALAIRLAQLRADPQLAEALGRAGVDRVRSRFTWSQVAWELEGVYRSVLAERASASKTWRERGRAPLRSIQPTALPSGTATGVAAAAAAGVGA